ncbi:TonB-dependent receptor [Haliea sp. E17]|uniref:TonB-dependent receptor n=1 Tax=Haliea sp. E17 TaxID=3401576 RepID=UPI003AB06D5D
MKPICTRTPLFLALAASCAVTAPQVAAQATSKQFALEEVVVTARRRAENLQDVPIAVTALSGEELALKGSSDITELALSVPSVTLEASRATTNTLTAFIRGVGQQDPVAGFEQGVGLYLDDVYLARPQGNVLDIYDVERIEILRGPQGTLYGRNTIGGAIKYVTRRLDDEFSGSLKATYGSYDQTDLVGTVSAPLGDSFRVGGTLASFQRDGYGDNLTTGQDQYDKDIFAYRLSAEWEPTDSLLFRFAYDNTEDDSSPVAGYRVYPGAFSGTPVLKDIYDSTAGAADQPSTAGIGGRNEFEADGWMLSVDWELSETITLRSITADREDEFNTVIDFDGLAGMDLDAPGIYDNEQFSQEFQLLYNSERIQLVAGLYYLDASAGTEFDVVLGNIGVSAYSNGVAKTESWSAFADLTYNLTEQLSLAVGGRYTEDTRSADVYRASYLGINSPAFGGTGVQLGVTSDYSAEKTFYDFSPRINLSYHWNDDITTYAGYSQGFKAGMFDPRGANFVFADVEDGVAPENLDSFEVGLKSRYWNGRAVTNIALFYSEYTDMQVPGSAGLDTNADGINDTFVGTLYNAGKSEISGIEIEGNFLLTENFSVQVAASFLDTNIKEWIVDGVDVSDDVVIQNTPEEMGYIALNYNRDLFSGNTNFNLNWSYKGDVAQFETPVPEIDQDAYDTINASIVWTSASGDWLLGLNGKNLTDEEIKTSGYCFGFTCPSALGLENNTTVFYAPPRTISASVEYKF